MIEKLSKALLIFCLILGISSGALAQVPQTGSLKGTISDAEGNALPGVTLTLSSTALMGKMTFVTTEKGAYRFPAIPPGTYTITTSMPGFKTIERGNIIIRTGMTITIDFTLEVAAVEEEITVTAAAPTIDVESAKISVVMDQELLKNIPMARDLHDIVNAAPGAISEGVSSRRTSSIHGATVRGTTYALEGVNMDDPVVRYPITNINFDVMEEVEMITAGHPASVGFTDGGYINVVSKSGGNNFSGGAVLYFTNKDMTEKLWTDEQVAAFGVTQPSVDKLWFDGSLTFGGPIIKDRIWFFTNVRYIKQEQTNEFIGPWTDILGRTHNPYEYSEEQKMGFLKLSSQITPKIKFVGMFNIVDVYRPVSSSSARNPFISTSVWDGDRAYTGSGVLTYVLNQNTFAELRVGYNRHWMPQYMQEEARDLPYITDSGDLYGALTGASYNSIYLRWKFQAGVHFTRFQDNFLGGDHEFKGGLDYEEPYSDLDRWRKNNMYLYIDSRNPNNYYYYGDHGRVGFNYFPPTNGYPMPNNARRIGVYLQDSGTFAQRLTLNIGIRYDRSWTWKPVLEKPESGNPISVFIGETIVRPYVAAQYPDKFPEGINPFGVLTSPEWKDLMTWNSFSPRLGITYDLFGNGKTALKLSIARYTEYFMLVYVAPIRPFFPETVYFRWWDTNNSGFIPDMGDTFVPEPTDFRSYDNEYALERLDPNLKSPINDELTVGIWHELFKNFSLGVNFIYKNKKNIVFDALYGIDTNEYFYHPDMATTKKYYIPFTTTVPGADEFPDRTVTFYVQSNDAPLSFTRFTNVPELKRKYWALEFIFNKRMAEGWQLNGSVVYSKAYGNIGGWYGPSQGWTGRVDNPNDWVNSYGRIDIDRPLQIKLMGTARLPMSIVLSAYYVFMSGAPWGRTASIRPPADWCAANNAYRTYYSVNIETAGSRRYKSENWLDLRLEKEFGFGKYGRLGFYIDALNVLGFSDVSIGQNDVYRWEPVAEGANQAGSVRLQSNYKILSSVRGLRTIKVSARYSF